MSAKAKIMLLIDADNVSADIIEQAVARLLAEHGALHLRRAYCTPETAAKHQGLFKRLSIRPMVNLAAGKNSTDIALAVDAMDLAISEHPDVVVIASSDSDFAPLVLRLREKGCRVCGIGQEGKTGEEAPQSYDEFVDLAHRKAVASPRPTARTRPPARAAARPAVRDPAPAAPAARSRSRAKAVAPAPVAAAAPAVELAPMANAASAPTPATTPAPAPPVAGPAAKKSSRRKVAVDPASAAEPVVSAERAPAPAITAPPPVAMPKSRPPMSDDARRILAALPELIRGEKVELRIAAERLRDAGLIGKSASSTKFFAKFSDLFALSPEQQPNRVQYRPASGG
jgi:uncharacterized protein (TIGR00288 family)